MALEEAIRRHDSIQAADSRATSVGLSHCLNPDEILTPLRRRTERSQEIVRNVSLRQRRVSPGPLKTYGWKLRLSARLIVEEAECDCREERRTAEVVMGQARQDRECVTALWSALAHPATVAETAVKQLEDFDVMARRRSSS